MKRMNELIIELPDESVATPAGYFNAADVASPPSPLKDVAAPVPATVDIMPVAIVTLRMRKLSVSAMNTLPVLRITIKNQM